MKRERIVVLPENLSLFIITSILLSISPGPDNIYVLSHSIIYGKKEGILIAFGLCIGLVFHMSISLFGVSVIFMANNIIFLFFKIVGSCYLLYLAWCFFKTRNKPIKANENIPRFNGVKLIKKGILLNVSNPKVAIFFLAFFPQFLNGAVHYKNAQFYLLGGVFISIVFVVFSLISSLSDIARKKINRFNGALPLINIATSIIFVILAFNLLFVELD